MKSSLFLHMGPGLNAHCERQLLSAKWPHVDFWDQPKTLPTNAGFVELVRAVRTRIDSIFATTGKPVDLIGHSFGGHLVTHALQDFPLEKIGEVRMISTCYDLPRGFLKLLKALSSDAQTSPELAREIAEFLKKEGQENGSIDRVWTYIGWLVKDPAFLRLYFPTPSLFTKYAAVASTGPQLDAPTFESVLKDFFSNRFDQKPGPLKLSRPAIFEFGGKDPLIDFKREKDLWIRFYPDAKFHLAQSLGHYPHLESALI